MRPFQIAKTLLAALGAFLLINLAAQTVRADFTSEPGGVEINLGSDWDTLPAQGSFFVQERGRNRARGIVVNAGAFRVDVSVEQYIVIAVGSLTGGSDSQLNYLARQLGMERAEVDKVLASPAGKSVIDQVRKASRTAQLELISISHQSVSGITRYEIHSRMTSLDSKQTLYSRQFVMEGAAPHEIVQVAFISISKNVFTDKDLPAALHVKPRGK